MRIHSDLARGSEFEHLWLNRSLCSKVELLFFTPEWLRRELRKFLSLQEELEWVSVQQSTRPPKIYDGMLFPKDIIAASALPNFLCRN